MKAYIGLNSKKQQNITQEDIDAVVEVLHSNALTQGPAIEGFENALASFCRAKYAVAVNSATSALHLACKAMGLGPGDRLWTTPNTFVASANCALYCGAEVDFVDISDKHYNIDEVLLEEKLEKAAKDNTLPKIIIPVHFAGESANMKRIYELAKRYGIYVIEDASHALGAEYLGERVGSCQYSDAAVFSFHPVKIATTGEGGVVLSNNAEIADRIYHLRSHGITRDPEKMQSPSEGPWYYQQLSLGYNYRMTDLQAALGISQLSRVPNFIEKRSAIADFYSHHLHHIKARIPASHPDCTSSWHLYVIRVDMARIGISKKALFEKFWERCVPVNVHYIPVHTQPFYQNLGFQRGQFPNAEKHYEEAISLPIHCNLEQDELEHIVRETIAILD